MNEIETMVAKLQMLAVKPALSAAENAEAQAVMQSLKAKGMSNDEISQISKGRWSMSTVKGYTTGIAAPSPSPWQDAVSLLTDLIAANLSLDDVQAALAVDHSLAANKLALEEVMGFLKTVTAAGLDPAHLINEVKALQQSGLSLQAAVDVAALKDKMEGYGLTLEVMPALVKIAQQYGHPPQVVEAFSVYASLTELEAAVSAAKKELEKTQAEAAAAGQQLEQTEAKRQQLQAPMQAYQKVLEHGFSDKALIALSDLTAGYGGPKAVIAAVKKYTALEDVENQLNAAKAQLAGYESKISQAITRHGHLTSAIKMCQMLTTDHQYGLDAIGTILAVAQKFGEPVAVLKAIEAYGKLVSLENRASQFAGTVAERQKLLASLEAQFQEAKDKLNGLYAVVLEIGNRSGRLEGEFKASENWQRLLTIIQNPEQAAFGEHGQIVLMLVMSLQRWVKAHTANFRWSTETIEAGLKRFIEEMGGTLP